MRQPLLMLAMASCLAAPAAFAQSRADAPAAHGAASATAHTDATADDRGAASSARRAMTSFTSLLREAALQTQPSARTATAAPAAATLQADNRDLPDPPRTAVTP